MATLKNEGVRNEPLDHLMGLVGLEHVKEHFLMVYAKVRAARELNVDFPKREFNLNIIGNRGTGRLPPGLVFSMYITCEMAGSDYIIPGKSTVRKLYGEFLEILGVNGDVFEDVDHQKCCRTIELADFDDGELSEILRQMINRTFAKRVEGGTNGLYLRVFVRRLRHLQAQGDFHNIWSLQDSMWKLMERQRKRITRQLRDGTPADDSIFTKNDLLGSEPPKSDQIQALAELEDMVGLDQVKQSVRSLVDQVNRNFHLELQGKDPVKVNLNRVFLGDLGTGKRSVAVLYGRILVELGLLSSTRIAIKTPPEYVVQREQGDVNFREGILVINDAHLLPGYEVSSLYSRLSGGIMGALLAMAETGSKKNTCIILAGQAEGMRELFMKHDLRLAHAFSFDEAFCFPSFSGSDLKQVLSKELGKRHLYTSNETKEMAQELLRRTSFRPDFKNGYAVDDLLSRAKEAHCKSTSNSESSDKGRKTVLEFEDLDAEFASEVGQGKSCASFFEGFVGNEAILSRFERYRRTAAGMRRRGIDPRLHLPFTFVFRGPPGTGKTATARKIGPIFYDMGFVSDPEVIECSVTDLIGKYVGHTGPKVIKLLERAFGKVLFVDEAYRLREGKFAEEAVGEFLDALTKERFQRKLVIILAGYEEDMAQLMQTNRGLRSRFATNVDFKPMEPKDCLRLLQQCLSKLGIQLEGTDDAGNQEVKAYLNCFYRLRRSKSWAGARSVESLASDIAGHVYDSPTIAERTAGALRISPAAVISVMESTQSHQNGVSTSPSSTDISRRPLYL